MNYRFLSPKIKQIKIQDMYKKLNGYLSKYRKLVSSALVAVFYKLYKL